MERTRYAIKNASTMLITYILTIGISFIMRAIFIKQLGGQYLGLNGVFSSVLSVLSISDLGMESVFAYLLYKPLAENKEDTIREFIALFRKLYMFVGLFIFIVGICLLPFLPSIIGNQGRGLSNVTLIYLVMLINSAMSYLFTYNRTILNANQKNYVITSVTFVANIFVNLLQIIGLYVISSMLLYVTLFLISTLSVNIILSRMVLKEYPFLHNLPQHIEIKENDKKLLIRNTIGGLSNKMGSIVVFASDNILLSLFVNLSMVGLYSNYTMILNSLTGLVQKILGTLTASVGNLAVKAPEKGLSIFKQLNFYLTLIAFFIAPQLLTLLRPLVELWIGSEYVLSQYIVLLIVINFVLQISRLPSLTYIDAYGLQWIQKWKSVVEAILNIFFSLIALKVFELGLMGILLGTIGSTALFVLWYEPYIVFKYAFFLSRADQFKYLIKLLIEKLWLILPTIVTWIVMHFISGTGMIILVKLSLINFALSCILFMLFFRKRPEIKYIVNLVSNIKK
ncbi:lipopolysaccharide biosynthesis protein [Leuconostoc gasicomitatum]|uniref:Transporter n=1 Tax=Leuconostoc gasicomitatum TaxID=115778 RepID=A0A9Q3T057_9LACO|nr:transporter [Leuconostoc gasicomitatum]MBZ5963219.1 transporter [Leuconostoc gasicomitatum]